jgi:integrase
VDPANLALLASEQHRTIVLLLAFTGLRVSSVVTLRRDALQIGSDDHPYLRYRNVKLCREAVLPIGPVLADQLCLQEQYLSHTHHDQGTEFLLPSPPARHRGTSMVNDGAPLLVIQKVLDHASMETTGRYAHLHDETLRREMMRWQERVNIRGERIALTVDGPLEQAPTTRSERSTKTNSSTPARC